MIEAEGLGKTYAIYRSPALRLLQIFCGERKQLYTPFTALHPLSFRIGRGETVGIIGRNGSGKSTLLQLLAGTLTPTAGTLKVHGRIAALLELGAGFNPDFTGRENVYLNGNILGLTTEEIDELYAGIEAFAGIGEFINRPVSTYSSGMVVRLAFAIATAAQPDILIVDEALSVGDEAFQRKCFARIELMKQKGATILFVSHSAQAIIQLCDRALWLDSGVLQQDGSPKAVMDAYHRFLHREVTTLPAIENPSQTSESLQEYPPQGGIISDIRLLDEQEQPVTHLEHGGRYLLQYTLTLTEDAENIRCGMLLKTRTGVEAAGAVLHLAECGVTSCAAGAVYIITFAFNATLYAGQYFLNCGVVADKNGEETYLHRLVDAFTLEVIHPTRRNRHGVSPEGLVDLDFAASLQPGQ
jgi:lipopolysaccharide transport system ATP-binding protein